MKFEKYLGYIYMLLSVTFYFIHNVLLKISFLKPMENCYYNNILSLITVLLFFNYYRTNPVLYLLRSILIKKLLGLYFIVEE